MEAYMVAFVFTKLNAEMRWNSVFIGFQIAVKISKVKRLIHICDFLIVK